MKKTAILLALVAMTGCATQTYHINGSSSSEPTADKMQNFFISGLGQQQEINAASVCGGADKVIKVESKQEPVDILLGMLTAGIYTPRHAKVYCKK